ncbi:transcription elongation factor spt6, putative [Entamoeba dispar SAW760]|uniref:Transcription elongation factor spt6, putative n=1 Tax=Entamoeba dispar (strain ATCC PRA-260 / SAW760) TaxID=370354 RepID=B0EV07_ENTDS|nr:transcription elongation factor spt6, putative [Entamoeba dispar SAW760]EDR21644.1 transcription elongation factor spt6, putative [Entamoeba dispar SAW760]|eukprot:EDR21644.1 transcription elongation factor spt6, putative [Entamoeba dispar SAW760]
MKRSSDGKKSKYDSEEEYEKMSEDYDERNSEEEDVPRTREGYIAHDGFIASDDEEIEEEVPEEDAYEEDEEEKERRRIEREKRKLEKQRKKEEAKKKKRKLIKEDDDDEMEIENEQEMDEEIEDIGEDEEMTSKYLECLEPADKEKMKRTQRIETIYKTDCPERLYDRKSVLNKYNEEIDDQEWNRRIREEVEWLDGKLRYMIQLEAEDLMGVIRKILELMYKYHHELMYIYTYDRDWYYPYISRDYSKIDSYQVLDMLWMIWNFDEEYSIFCKEKEKVKEGLKEIPEERRALYSVELDSVVELPDLKLISDDFLLRYGKDQFDPLKQISKGKKSYQVLIQKNFKEMLDGFGLTADELAQNIKSNFKKTIPKMCPEIPQAIAARMVNPEFPEPKNIMSGAKMIFATEFAYNWYVRKFFFEEGLKDAELSTDPTQKGDEVINVFHKYAIIKRLRRKPIGLIRGKTDILNIFNAVNEGLLTMTIEIPQNIIENASTLLVGGDDLEEWRKYKKETLEFAFKYFITPYVVEQLKIELRKEAVDCLIHEAQYNLKRRIDVAQHFALGKYSKDISNISTLEKKFVGGIVFSKEGMMGVKVNAMTGEFIEGKYFGKNTSKYGEYEEELKKFFGRDTLVVGIEANTQRYVSVTATMKNNSDIECVGINKDLGRIYKKETKGELSELEFAGACVCRQLINPIAEFVHICCTKEKMLSIKLHWLQNTLNESEQNKMFSALNETLITIINSKGVDINQCIEYPHMEKMLDYVNGLGPIRSDYIFSHFRQYDFKVTSRKFLNETFKTDKLETVVDNCIGFIIISPKYSSKNLYLDQTRIHFSRYGLAETIVDDAFTGKRPIDDFTKKVMVLTREDYNRLDLEGYGKENEEKGHSIYICIMDIVNELIEPFKYQQASLAEAMMKDEEIFESVTNSSIQEFKKNQLIEFVLKPGSRERKKGYISEDLEVSIEDSINLNGVESGTTITGKIMTVDYGKCIIDVRCGNDVVNDYQYLENEYRQLQEKEKYLEVYPREYEHEKKEEVNRKDYGDVDLRGFEIVSVSKARSDVQQGSIGDYKIVPVSEEGVFKGKLLLVWKWTPSVILNVECKEESERYGRNMRIRFIKERKDFDNVRSLERYIKLINGYLADLRKHRRYNADDSLVDSALSKLKASQPNVFNYFLSVSKQQIGKIRISFIPGTKTVSSQFVRVGEDGFKWNGKTFNTTDRLVEEFKTEVTKILQKIQ